MLSAKSGAVAFNLSTGNQSVSGLGFTPKLVMFQTMPDTANIVSRVANMHATFGAYDGTTATVEACNAVNGTVNSDTARLADSTHVMYIADPPGTMTDDFSATAVSLDSDGFTINIDNAPPINYRFGYWALGGNDITNAKVGRFSSAGVTGLQSVTGVGFEPDVVIIFSTFTTGSIPQSTTEAFRTMGWANGLATGNQYAMGTYYQDGAPQAGSGTAKAQNTGHIIFAPSSTAAIGIKAILTSFDPDGFTLNFTTHALAVPLNFSYIAIKGGVDFKSAVGHKTFTNNATSATNSVTGLAFQPKTGLFAGIGTQTLNSLTQTAIDSIGWADNTISSFMSAGTSRQFAGTWSNWHATHDARINRVIDYSSGTLIEDVSVQTWNADGFTILNNKGASPSTGTSVGYLVMSGNPTPPVSTDYNFGFIV